MKKTVRRLLCILVTGILFLVNNIPLQVLGFSEIFGEDPISKPSSGTILLQINQQTYPAYIIQDGANFLGYEFPFYDLFSKPQEGVIINLDEEQKSISDVSSIRDYIFSGDYSSAYDVNSDQKIGVQDLCYVAREYFYDPRLYLSDMETFKNRVMEIGDFGGEIRFDPDYWYPPLWWEITTPEGDMIDPLVLKDLEKGAKYFGIERYEIRYIGGSPQLGMYFVPPLSMQSSLGVDELMFYYGTGEELISLWTEEDVIACEENCIGNVADIKNHNAFWRTITPEFLDSYKALQMRLNKSRTFCYVLSHSSHLYPEFALFPISE